MLFRTQISKMDLFVKRVKTVTQLSAKAPSQMFD